MNMGLSTAGLGGYERMEMRLVNNTLKSRFQSILLTLVLLMPSIVRTQVKQPVQIDELGRYSSEDIEARLDNAIFQLSSHPEAAVHLVFSRAQNQTLGAVHRSFAVMRTYLIYRKIDPKRIISTFCEPLREEVTQIWLVDPNAIRQNCVEEKVAITSTTMFDSAPSLNADPNCGSCCVVDCFGPAA